MIRDSAIDLFVTSDAVEFYGTGTGDDYGGYEIEGTGEKGLAVHLILTAVDSDLSSTVSLAVVVLGSSSTTITSASGTYPIVAARHDITAAGEYIIPFTTHLRTVVVDFRMESASGGLKADSAWITLNPGIDWTRVPEWH